MNYPGVPLILGSIEATRPVFLIVMGISLMMIAWRFAKKASGWSPRLMMAGAILLGFGYSILLPLYEAGKIGRYTSPVHFHGDEDLILAFHALKIFTMNVGWFLLGLGLAIHTKILTAPPLKHPHPSPPSSHESAA